MNYSNKRDASFNKARKRREISIAILNDHLEKANTGMRFIRKHDNLKTMTTAERVRHNTLNNYMSEVPFTSAMALYYILTKEHRKKQVPFIFLYKNGGVYLKIPKEYKETVQEYLQLLTHYNYHILMIDETTQTYSFPVSISTLCTPPWKHTMSTSKGNTNRLQFYGQIVSFRSLDCKDLQGTIIDELNKIITQ